MAIALTGLGALTRTEQRMLATLLNAWPVKPVVVIWAGGFQVSGGFSPAEAGGYLRVIHEGMGELLRLAGAIPSPKPARDVQRVDPAGHLGPNERAFLLQCVHKLGPNVVAATPKGLLMQLETGTQPDWAPLNLLARGLIAVGQNTSAALRVAPPRTLKA